jgi:hypothetical protein
MTCISVETVGQFLKKLNIISPYEIALLLLHLFKREINRSKEICPHLKAKSKYTKSGHNSKCISTEE